MKSILQYAALLIVIIGAVFGLTFLTQNTSAPVEKKGSGVGDAAETESGSPLTVIEKEAVWDENDRAYKAEFEQGSHGHYDFWVSNSHSKPVDVALLTTSCMCTEVQLGIIPPAEWHAWRRRVDDLAPVNVLMGLVRAPNLAGMLAHNGFGEKVQWTTLARRDKNSTATEAHVPPADSTTGPQWAVIRMSWDGKSSQNLQADVQHRIGTNTEVTRFQVPISIVPPVLISNPALSIGDLNFNEQREVVVFVWSATRDDFTVSIEDPSHDPCIVAGPPRRMTPEERTTIPLALRATDKIPPTKMRSGYIIPIVVYERRDGKQLELGPLSRRLTVRTDAIPDPTMVLVQGTVRGLVDVGEAGDKATEKDRVNLGTFRADRVKETTVMVSAREPNVNLRLKSVRPDYLNVSLTELPGSVGLPQWKLQVTVEANRVSGLLPGDSAIYLETVGPSPRAIRIPVVGNATVR
jgi:hypothetical protein